MSAAAIGAAGWLHMNNRIPLERKVEQERWPYVDEEVQFQPAELQEISRRVVMVTYRKRKVLEHA